MELVKVMNKQTQAFFHQVPKLVHAMDVDYIPAPISEIENIFSTEKNASFEHGEAARWVLLNKRKKTIGRIAVFVRWNTAFSGKTPAGGIGFFDCVNNQVAANLLFDVAKNWLERRGLKAMDGPINFGENYHWWGLHLEGERRPLFGHNFAASYYPKLFKDYGFGIYFKQFCYEIDLKSLGFVENVRPKAQALESKNAIICKHVEGLTNQQIAEYFCTVYNKGWTEHANKPSLLPAQMLSVLEKMKPILDPQLIWFAYLEEQPVGVFVMIPDINQILGKIRKDTLNFFDKLRFKYLQSKDGMRRAHGFVFGVDAQHHNKGISTLLISKSAEFLEKSRKYDFIELSWIGDFNPPMLSLIESMGLKPMRTLGTLRKYFDPKQPFERSPIIGQKNQNVASEKAVLIDVILKNVIVG